MKPIMTSEEIISEISTRFERNKKYNLSVSYSKFLKKQWLSYDYVIKMIDEWKFDIKKFLNTKPPERMAETIKELKNNADKEVLIIESFVKKELKSKIEK